MGKVILLYGDEDYLKKLKKEKLISEIVSPDDTMNLSYFEGSDIDIQEIIDIAETMPFFAEQRLIVIENSGFFKEASDRLYDFLNDLPETVSFIFSENETDKRNRLFKLVSKVGEAIEVKTPQADQLVKWFAQRASKNGFKIRESTANYFVEKCGTDMNSLNNEMEKLFSYCAGEEVIENKHIDDICTGSVQNEIFRMLEDMTSGNKTSALKRYYDLISLREPPMRILYLISRQFRIMYIVRSMTDAKASNNDIASAAGIPPFSVKKYLSNAKKMNIDRIREAMEECAALEEAVKVGNMNEQMSVELLLVKYCS